MLLTIKSFNEENGLHIEFNDGYFLDFVPKMANYVKYNVYYNATNKIFKKGISDFNEVLGKQVVGISLNNDKQINQTRPIIQTENQMYRDSDEWKNKVEYVRNVSNGICFDCGQKFNKTELAAHHKDYYNNKEAEDYKCNVDKLIALCFNCHQKRHKL